MNCKIKAPTLIDGYIVTTRERGNAIILGGRLKGVRHLYNNGGINHARYYDDNLNSAGGESGVISSIDKEFDIMKVYVIEDIYKYTIEQLINGLPEDGVKCIWSRVEDKPVENKNDDKKSYEELQEVIDSITKTLTTFFENK